MKHPVYPCLWFDGKVLEAAKFYCWERLTEKGEESRCGWLKDQFGVSWQVIPSILGSLMSDPQRAPRVMQAFFKMRKFDMEKLMNT